MWATLKASETWCLRDNKMTLFRTKKAMTTAMCGIKLIEKKCGQELMNLLGLKEALDRLVEVHEMDMFEEE